MERVTEEVRALMQERHDRRKAELHASGRDVQFDVGSVGNRGLLKLLRKYCYHRGELPGH